jgi:proline iminopeptidase
MSASDGFVTTGEGIRLYYRAIGNGAKPVLIPNGMHVLEDFERLAFGRTLIFYDLRNRGRSDAVGEPARLKGGIHNDVEDVDAVRRHFGMERIALIGHSYVGITVVLHAAKYPAHVDRVVQIGPMQPDHSKQYPPELTAADAVLPEVMAQLKELERQRGAVDRAEFCRRFWSVLSVLYVTDPRDAGRIRWGRCQLENELNFMKYWMGFLIPSIQALEMKPADFDRAAMPVLTVHGTRDRSAPFGGGVDWVSLLPNARLLKVENAGHVPWVEAPELVLGSIRTFLDGGWPVAA